LRPHRKPELPEKRVQISLGQFPLLEEMMQKMLFDGAADSFEESVLLYKLNGNESVRALVAEIDAVLSGPFSEADTLAFVDRHSDYVVNDSGRETLQTIKSLLQATEPQQK
jgi:hypothetical protein